MFLYFRILSLFLVKRKRKQALPGGNLRAIPFTDKLYKGRFRASFFPYTGILIWLRKPIFSFLLPSYNYKSYKTTFYQ
jgi:hypothetical protein